MVESLTPQAQGFYWVDLIQSEVRILRGRYTTRILEAGDPQRPTLLLLHGTGGHLENYARNIPALAEHFHVVALDFIWHGRSQTNDYNAEIIPYLVDQLLDVQDQLGIASSFVEGQSLGGWVAMRFALHHPDRVRGLVLTTTQGYVPDQGAIEGYAEPNWASNLASSIDVLQNPTFDNVRRRMARILANPDHLTNEAIAVRQALYRQPALAEVQQRFIREYLGGDIIRKHVITDALARTIATPTLVYWGDKNRTPPALGNHIANQFQNGRFHCAADTGHWAQFESAAEHNRVVIDFLVEVSDQKQNHYEENTDG